MKHLWLLWLAFGLSVAVGAGYLTHAPTLVTAIGAIGVAFVVTVAQGLRVAPLLGSVMAIGYGYLAYQSQFYGDMAVNWFYHLPLYLAAIYTWFKADKAKSPPKDLTTEEFMRCLWVFALLDLILTFILMGADGRLPMLDATSTAAALLGSYLLFKRCVDQWLFWTIGNFCGVVMWTIAAWEDPTLAPMVVMWFVFFLNGLWGWSRWTKQQD